MMLLSLFHYGHTTNKYVKTVQTDFSSMTLGPYWSFLEKPEKHLESANFHQDTHFPVYYDFHPKTNTPTYKTSLLHLE